MIILYIWNYCGICTSGFHIRSIPLNLGRILIKVFKRIFKVFRHNFFPALTALNLPFRLSDWLVNVKPSRPNQMIASPEKSQKNISHIQPTFIVFLPNFKTLSKFQSETYCQDASVTRADVCLVKTETPWPSCTMIITMDTTNCHDL